MTTIQDLIRRLPKEIQVHIAEYNIDHRLLFRKVLEELIETENECCFCKKIINPRYKCYGLYVYTWHRNKMIYCNEDCCEAGDHGKLKAREKWLRYLNRL